MQGRRHGVGVYKLRDGHEYSGEWREDLPDGAGRFVDDMGRVVEGDFQKRYALDQLRREGLSGKRA